MLALGPLVPLPLWAITLLFASILLTKDVADDLRHSRLHWSHLWSQRKGETFPILVAADDGAESTNLPSPIPVLQESKTLTALRRVPWLIVPFVVGVFIIVHALSLVGLTKWLADLLLAHIGACDSASSVMKASVGLTFLTSLLCNLLNNQPATILLTRVLDEPSFRLLSPIAYRTSAYAVIMGSNLGGNFTLIGALAGVMWSSILVQKGVPMSALKFARFGCIVMFPVAIIGSVVLGLQHVVVVRETACT